MTSPGSRFEELYNNALIGDLVTRHVLSNEERYAVQLGGLSALGLSTIELKDEISILLQEGCPVGLAEDVLTQMAAYIGYPQSRRCLASLKEALGNHDPHSHLCERNTQTLSASDRHAIGTKEYARLNPEALNTINAAFGDLAPDVIDLTFRIFGDVYASSRQPLDLRQLATITTLAVLGSAAPQLRFHIGAGMHVGLTTGQLVEVIAWVQFFSGAPAAYNALVELKASLAEGTSATPAYQ